MGTEVRVPSLGSVSTQRWEWQGGLIAAANGGASLHKEFVRDLIYWLTSINGFRQAHLSLAPNLFLYEFGNLKNKLRSDTPHV